MSHQQLRSYGDGVTDVENYISFTVSSIAIWVIVIDAEKYFSFKRCCMGNCN